VVKDAPKNGFNVDVVNFGHMKLVQMSVILFAIFVTSARTFSLRLQRREEKENAD